MNIYALAEHREGKLRDTTWEAISAARQMAEGLNGELTCLLLGKETEQMASELAKYSPKTVVIEDNGLENFNSEPYTRALVNYLADKEPYMLVMCASNSTIDLAPGLTVKLDASLATDCFKLETHDSKPVAWRQMYSYKVNTLVSFKDAQRIVVTVRGGAYPAAQPLETPGAVETAGVEVSSEALKKQIVGFEEAEKGDVDIASADVIIAIGRGIGDEDDLELFESLAETMGGVLACSRPIVDKNLLPKYHQVGTSGVEVKPKVYLALGISGAFQHMGGIKGSPLIIAVNKDQKAPIFRTAQYGIVGDLFEVATALEEAISG
jgi:electron transfer flavoprotein alpha subunit